MTLEARRSPDDGGPKSVEQVERELAKLRMNDDGSLGLRACVLNLLVVTDEESADDVTKTISALADRYPSRAIVLISDPESPPKLNVGLSAFCGLRGGSSASVCSEQVVVRAEGETALHLESVAGPLLIPDLPTFLFYPADLPDSSPEFDRLASLADRVILDSSSSPSGCEESLRRISSLVLRPEDSSPPIGDLQWAGLSSWRALARELFGSPETRRELQNIREVEVMYSGGGECRALLFAGWVSHSLGWGCERHERSGRGREITFRSPEDLEVNFGITPSESDADLSRITLKTGDCEFLISRRKDRAEARISVERDGETVAHRAVRIGRFDTGAMLGEELEFKGRDPVYESSLEMVTEILEA